MAKKVKIRARNAAALKKELSGVTSHQKEDMVSLDEAATELRRGSGQLRVIARAGQIPGAKKITVKGHRKWMVPRSSVEQLKLDVMTAENTAAEPGKRRPTRTRVVEAAEEKFAGQVLDRFGAEAMSRTYSPVVRWSAETASPKSPGTPMLFISDVHYGERVDPEQVLNANEFDVAICERRLKHVFEMAVTLLQNHLAAPSYDGIVLVLGGDMINGALHEDTVGANEETPLVQAIEVARLLADAVAFLAQEFPRVTIYCVPGNHGRMTSRPWAKFYAKTNLDWLSYVMLKDYCRDLENVEVNAPPVRDLTFTVANRRYRLTHGDQFRGGDGIIGPLGPVTRGDVRKRFAASLMPAATGVMYDTMLCGHFHQLLMLTRLIMNGSVKGFDEFALSINVPFEPPQQALWTVHPRHAHTWYMPVLCDERR